VTVACDLCGQESSRDPALEVECPACGAAVGSSCRRPSGHPIMGKAPHASRDRLAMELVPGYGRCPLATHQLQFENLEA